MQKSGIFTTTYVKANWISSRKDRKNCLRYDRNGHRNNVEEDTPKFAGYSRRVLQDEDGEVLDDRDEEEHEGDVEDDAALEDLRSIWTNIL